LVEINTDRPVEGTSEVLVFPFLEVLWVKVT